MRDQRHIAIAMNERNKHSGISPQAPMIGVGIPQMPSPIPAQSSPSVSALHGMANGMKSPQPHQGNMPTQPMAPANKIPNLNKLPVNPYKMAGIGKIDNFPRLFKVAKL